MAPAPERGETPQCDVCRHSLVYIGVAVVATQRCSCCQSNLCDPCAKRHARLFSDARFVDLPVELGAGRATPA